MTSMTRLLMTALSACESAYDDDRVIVDTLVSMGWTPPPVKPDPPREPVRAWATDIKDERREYKGEYGKLTAGGKEYELIEAGYCQMVPHNWSDKCPVTLSSRVTIREDDGTYFTGLAEEVAGWQKVTHYAVVLEAVEK